MVCTNVGTLREATLAMLVTEKDLQTFRSDPGPSSMDCQNISLLAGVVSLTISVCKNLVTQTFSKVQTLQQIVCNILFTCTI